MRRGLVVLLGLSMATATSQPADEPPPLITGHEFDGYLWGDRVFCVHVTPGATSCCGRPAVEHARVPVDTSTWASGDQATKLQSDK